MFELIGVWLGRGSRAGRLRGWIGMGVLWMLSRWVRGAKRRESALPDGRALSA